MTPHLSPIMTRLDDACIPVDVPAISGQVLPLVSFSKCKDRKSGCREYLRARLSASKCTALLYLLIPPSAWIRERTRLRAFY